MRRTNAMVIAILGVVGVVAACGGSVVSSPGGDAASPAPAGGTVPSAEAPASAGAPSSEPAGGGGGSAADTCGLVTAAEIDAIFGVNGTTQELLEGPPDTCDYQLDSAPFAATVWTKGSPAYVYEAMTADASSTPISGIGDRAVYNSAMQLVIVQKGDSLFTVAVFDQTRTDDQRIELMKAIATQAAGRL